MGRMVLNMYEKIRSYSPLELLLSFILIEQCFLYVNKFMGFKKFLAHVQSFSSLLRGGTSMICSLPSSLWI